MLRWCWLSLAVWLFACQPVPTFSEDVAPILAKKCQYCHLEGGLGPFPLLTYGQTKAHAFDVLDEIEEGDMPPFLIDNQGACGSFRGDPSLTPEEKDTIRRWVEGGTPKGPDLPFPPLLEPYHLTGATHELEMPEPYQPAEPVADDFRCFLLDATSLEGVLFDGYEFFPGEQSVVQGMSLYSFFEESSEARALSLDEADEAPGFACPGLLADSMALPLLAWTPGVPAVEFPPGANFRTFSPRMVILRVHYNYSHHAENRVQGATPTPYHGGPGQPVSDQSRLVLRASSSFGGDTSFAGVLLTNFSLPPGQDEALIRGDNSLDRGFMDVYAAYPLMGRRGRTMRVTATSFRGEEVCLAQLNDWEPRWAQFYFYEEPFLLPSDSLFSVTCSYQTRGDLEEIEGGIGADDEFCGGLFLVKFNDSF